MRTIWQGDTDDLVGSLTTAGGALKLARHPPHCDPAAIHTRAPIETAARMEPDAIDGD